MKDKLAAAMEDALDGIGWNVPTEDALDLATRFLAYLAADLPDEMVDAALNAAIPDFTAGTPYQASIGEFVNAADIRAALTAALTVGAE